MKWLRSIIWTAFVLQTSMVFGHARLNSPTPRNNNSGIKSGPCGGLARSPDPTLVQGGQPLTINWEETVNHPGKFLFSLSMGNDADFQQIQQINDNQDSGATPHFYSTTVTLPNINCDSCTLQLIQSMEENPNAPSYYYSCADLKIVSSSAASPPVQGQQVINAPAAPAKMAGCGLVKESLQSPPNFKMIGLIALLMLGPLLILANYRRREVSRIRTRS